MIATAHKNKMEDKNASYYMSLPYTFIIQPHTDESGFYYVGRVMELDGCMSDGETRYEVLDNLQEAMEGWIETSLANGLAVPEPASQGVVFSLQKALA